MSLLVPHLLSLAALLLPSARAEDVATARRMTGLPGEASVHIELDAGAWPVASTVTLDAPELDEAVAIGTVAQATVERPDAGRHALVETFVGTAALGKADTGAYDVTVTLTTAGKVWRAGKVSVDGARERAWIDFGDDTAVVGTVEARGGGKGKPRFVVRVADAKGGIADGVELTVAPRGGEPAAATAVPTTFHGATLLVEADEGTADALLDAAPFSQGDIEVDWDADHDGDGKPDASGVATLAIDARDIVAPVGEVLAAGDGDALFDIEVQAADIEEVLGGLLVTAEDDDDTTGPILLGWEWMRPEFYVDVSTSADPTGAELTFALTYYNAAGKPLGPTESCTLVLSEKASCWTADKASKIGPGIKIDNLSVGTRVPMQGPAVDTYNPETWPAKVAVTVKPTSDKLLVLGADQVGARATLWTDTTVQSDAIRFDPETATGGIDLLLETYDVDGQLSGTARAMCCWGGILIDGVKFEVE